MSGLSIRIIKTGEVRRRLGSAEKPATLDTIMALIASGALPRPVIITGSGTGKRMMFDADAVDIAILRLKQKAAA
jgi:hypothetical protein